MDDTLAIRLDRYFEKAELKFSTVKVLDVAGQALWESAQNYFNDARHFKDGGELISSLAALEYAEGFVDAGRKLGFLTAEHTGELD